MGRLRIQCGPRLGERPLGYTNLVGRHWSCDVLLSCDDAPLRWVEIRWLGASWGWRALAREGDTVGPSTWLRPGWRALTPKDASSRSVRLRNQATIELVDDSPPQPFAVDLQNGRTLTRSMLMETLTSVGITPWRHPSGELLHDGAVLVIAGRPLRLHLPQRAVVNEPETPSLLHPDTILKLDATSLEGAVEFPNSRVELSAEMVRMLVPYAEARTNEYAYEDGWITRDDAYDRWKELGGNPSSPPQRLGWLRGKLKTALVRHGIADVDAIFESQRVGQWYANRLGLAPEQIVVT